VSSLNAPRADVEVVGDISCAKVNLWGENRPRIAKLRLVEDLDPFNWRTTGEKKSPAGMT